MIDKKRSYTVDILCLCSSFTIALGELFSTDPEYPISTALDCFFSAMLFFGWLRLALFVIVWCVTRTIPYWRWHSIVMHIACCFAVGGRVVFEAGGPGPVVAGQVLGFIGVWICYGIIRFVVFLFKSLFDQSFIFLWFSFQIQRLISKRSTYEPHP